METKIFRVKGQFEMGDETKKFTKELKAFEEKDIYEKLYSEFGSKHGIKKYQIHIDKIEEISIDDVQDPIIKDIS